MYKLLLDFYYRMNLQKRNFKLILLKVIPAALKYYRGISRHTFNNTISQLMLVRHECQRKI